MASAHAILWKLRYPRYIHCAKMLFGDAAELLVEEILLQGQARLGSAVSKTTSKLNDSLVSIASGEHVCLFATYFLYLQATFAPHVDNLLLCFILASYLTVCINFAALPEISPNLVRDKVTTLVKARLLRRCEDVVKDKEGKFAVASDAVVDPELLFALPTALDFGNCFDIFKIQQ